MSNQASRHIFVGNLSRNVLKEEIKDIFHKYGRIIHIHWKPPTHPRGFCFITFENTGGAENAIRGGHGFLFRGTKLRVELARVGRNSNHMSGDVDGGQGDGIEFAHGGRSSNHISGDVDGGQGDGGGRAGGVSPSRRSEYRVIVTGLPSSATWRDVKDHMCQAGYVRFVLLWRGVGDRTKGIVDFTNYHHMKNAIDNLHDSEFCSRLSRARSIIRVRECKAYN